MLEALSMSRTSSKAPASYTKLSFGTGVTPVATYDFAAAVKDDKIHVVGGSSWNQTHLVFDAVTKSWATKQSIPYDMYQGKAAWVDGKLYATWGVNGTSNRLFAHSYDPATNTWTNINDQPYYNTTGFAGESEGLLYCYGMDTGLRIFTPTTGQWMNYAISPPRPAASTDFVGKIVDGIFYLAGGYRLKELWALDLITRTWSRRADMPHSRYQAMGMAQLGRRLFLYGGTDDQGKQRTSLLAYDIDKDEWEEYDDAPAAISVVTRGILEAAGGKLYLFNGIGKTGTSVAETWEITV